MLTKDYLAKWRVRVKLANMNKNLVKKIFDNFSKAINGTTEKSLKNWYNFTKYG